jgi:hypothetical protein
MNTVTLTLRTGGERRYQVAGRDDFSRALTAYEKRGLVIITEADGSEHAFQSEEILAMHWNSGTEDR